MRITENKQENVKQFKILNFLNTIQLQNYLSIDIIFESTGKLVNGKGLSEGKQDMPCHYSVL